MANLLGVVMCGGQSSRMGTDKGMVNFGGQTWAQIACNKLLDLDIPVKLSVNANQVGAYSRLFDISDLIVDELSIPGPLNGLLSVHTKHPDQNILILACDMTAMDNNTLRQLKDSYQADPDHDYYAYHNGDFFEPLCAIYTAKALNCLKIKETKNYSLQQVLKNADTKSLAVLNLHNFTNQNTL